MFCTILLRLAKLNPVEGQQIESFRDKVPVPLKEHQIFRPKMTGFAVRVHFSLSRIENTTTLGKLEI